MVPLGLLWSICPELDILMKGSFYCVITRGKKIMPDRLKKSLASGSESADISDTRFFL